MTIGGLPAHVLLVHAVLVLLPLSALLVVLVAVWPAAAARLGLVTAILAVASAVLVPITTEAGEWLEHRVPRTPLLRAHTHLGDRVLPWAIGLAVVAVALHLRRVLPGRRHRAAPEPSTGAPSVTRRLGTVAAAVVAVVVAVGSVVVIYQVGDSGARAVWTDRFSPTPIPRASSSPPVGGVPVGRR